MDGGYGAHTAAASQAHRYVKANITSYDNGYHFPVGPLWKTFNEAFYVMEEERKELTRVAKDSAALARLEKIAKFPTTREIQDTYQILIAESRLTSPAAKAAKQLQELTVIAKQEQLNILQPLIYDDKKLAETMDMNHQFARMSNGFMTTKYRVIYSAEADTKDKNLQTVFDPPSGVWKQFFGARKSLPNPDDRMEYVGQIARDFHRLMQNQRAYMERELLKIRTRGENA
jgi:hypothetical protein